MGTTIQLRELKEVLVRLRRLTISTLHAHWETIVTMYLRALQARIQIQDRHKDVHIIGNQPVGIIIIRTRDVNGLLGSPPSNCWLRLRDLKESKVTY